MSNEFGVPDDIPQVSENITGNTEKTSPRSLPDLERWEGEHDPEQRADEIKREKQISGELDEIVAGTDTTESDSNILLGDFKNAEIKEDGKIQLPKEQIEPLMIKARRHARKFRASLPSFFRGYPTAAEYDSHVGNFSTRTAVLRDDSERRVFAVADYPLSRVQRRVDQAQKWATNMKTYKVPSGEWKETYESRSNIPVIDSPDQNIVLMPYVDNINARDLFAHNKVITDFGACDWAADIDLEGKLQIGEAIVHTLEDLHNRGITWGEPILNNIIIAKNKQPIIVDPENRYYKNVPLNEQKARDLRQVLYSIAGALHESEGVNDFSTLVKRILDLYTDDEVINTLKKLSTKNASLLQKAEEFGMFQISFENHDKMTEAVRQYIRNPDKQPAADTA